MAEERRIASPLSLLHEVEAASEVLALTYSFNAAFWERSALSLARQLRAKVTVVSDSAMAVIDPRAVRKAGITYLDGRAAVEGGGAFHPKLFVIAGPKQAIVAVGSGNLTLPGWNGNAEVWTILRGSSDGAPSALRAIADFLIDLPVVVRFSHGVDQAFERTASLLRRFPPTEPSPGLVTSLQEPIVDQLPSGPVDSLIVASPFLDHRSLAVGRLIERFKPYTWEVVLDREANYDGASLVSLAKSHGGSLGTIDSDRYHHGKVVEWVVGRERSALTGSPNLSVSGLLRSASKGGNVELGLVDKIETSLRPKTSTVTPFEGYREKEYRRQQRDEPGVLLLGARIDEHGLKLDLVRPLDTPASLLIAENDIWRTSALAIPAGMNPISVDLRVPSGTLVRLRIGHDRLTNIVAATLLELPLRPSIPSVGRVETNEADVFDDPRIAEQFALDLAELRSLVRQGGDSVVQSDAKAPRPRKLTFESWEEYLEHVTARLGDTMTRYGLALPRLESVAEWVDTQIDPDDPDEADDAHEPPERPIRSMRSAPVPFRNRYRRWAERLVEALPLLLPAAQLVGARLLLRSVAGGVWDDREESYELLLKTASALGRSKAQFAEETPRLASMAALCLTVARRQISLEATGSKELSYMKAVDSCRHLVGLAADEFASAYTEELLPELGVEVEPSRVLDIGHKLADPLDHVMLDAEDLGLRVRRDDRLIRILEWDLHPRDAALRVLARGQKLSPIAVDYRQDDQQVFVAWSRPNLVIEESSDDTFNGELLRLDKLEPSDLRKLDPVTVRDLTVERWATASSRPQHVMKAIGTVSANAS